MADVGQFWEMRKMSDGASGTNCNVYSIGCEWIFKHLIDCNGSQWIKNSCFTDLQKKNGESNRMYINGYQWICLELPG